MKTASGFATSCFPRYLLPELRAVCGDRRDVTLCFDRGGWSPDLSATITDAGFHLLTYRKAQGGRSPARTASTEVTFTAGDGRDRVYDLADADVTITVTSGERKGRVLELRQVTRRDKGKQVHILTTRGRDDVRIARSPTSLWAAMNASNGHWPIAPSTQRATDN